MKSNVHSSLYFSAYPLKAVEAEASKAPADSSPYLKAILCGKTKTLSRVRVMPMILPYREKRLTVVKTAVSIENMELDQTEWYNNYE